MEDSGDAVKDSGDAGKVEAGPQKVSYAEMRMVAQEIHRLNQTQRRIRTAGMVFTGLLVGTALFAGVITLLYSAFTETEISSDDQQLAMVKKGTNKVVATTASLEDVDASDLVDYGRTGKDASGNPDGDWALDDERISRIRSLSWKNGPTLEVHHVAEIVRHDGKDARVEITTKAQHRITIWDSDGVDNFDIKMKRYNPSTKKYDAEIEVNADGDESQVEEGRGTTGRGRVLVSLHRPVLEARPRAINIDDFWDDDS
jgi:hypothetical protein